MNEHLEIAVLKHAGRRHILRKRPSLPFTVGQATARCGAEGWFERTVYVTPNRAALAHNRDDICDKCFTDLMHERLQKHEAHVPCIYNVVGTWLRIVPRGVSEEVLDIWASAWRWFEVTAT